NCSLGRKSCRSNVTYLKIKGFITKIKDLHPEKQVQILLRLQFWEFMSRFQELCGVWREYVRNFG
ncbi:hypothetical protein QT711_15745, partial [Sporosarcina saromensis]